MLFADLKRVPPESRDNRGRSVASLWLAAVATFSASIILLVDPMVTILYSGIIMVGSLNHLLVTRGSLDAAQLVVHNLLDPWFVGVFLVALLAIAVLNFDRLLQLMSVAKQGAANRRVLVVLGGLVVSSLVLNLLSTSLARNMEPIGVYLGSKSAQVGDSVEVFVNSPNHSFELELVKFGTSDSEDVVTFIRALPRTVQNTHPLAYEAGAAWERTTEISTVGLTPGVYAVKVKSGGGGSREHFLPEVAGE